MRHAFLSYVGDDRQFARRLDGELRRQGIKTWLDRDDIRPGTPWRKAVTEAIHDGAAFLALLTPALVRRRETYMRDELRLALDLWHAGRVEEGWLIPILAGGCRAADLSGAEMRELGALNAIDLNDNWDDGLRSLINHLSAYQDEIERQIIHERERRVAQRALSLRPVDVPVDPAFLDDFEMLVEHTILSGDLRAGAELYLEIREQRSIDYARLAEYRRWAKLLALFSIEGAPPNDFGGLDSARSAAILTDWGSANYHIGDLDLAKKCFVGASARSQTPAGEWTCRYNLMSVALRAGEIRVAESLGGQCLNLVHEHLGDHYLAQTLSTLGYVEHLFSHGTRSEELFSRARDAYPSAWSRQTAYRYLMRRRDLGRLSQEVGLLSEMTRGFEAADSPVALHLRVLRGFVALEVGDVDLARQVVEELRSRCESTAEVGTRAEFRLLETECRAKMDESPASLAAADAGLDLANRTGMRTYSNVFRVRRAATLRISGQTDIALQECLVVIRDCLDSGFVIGAGSAFANAALALADLGDISEGRRRLAQAEKVLESSGGDDWLGIAAVRRRFAGLPAG